MRFRFATPADIPACLQLLMDDGRFCIDPAMVGSLPAIWTTLVNRRQTPAACFVVWEDLPVSAQPRAFSLGLFIQDHVIEDAFAHPAPYLANRIYAAMMSGQRPHMDRAEMATACASNQLNLVILHFVQQHHDLTHQESQALAQAGPLAWHFSYAGFRMKQILWEVYGEQHRANMLGWGFRITHDFQPATTGRSCSEPHWARLAREHVPPDPHNVMAMWVFHPATPRLRLSPAQQQVVLHALQGDTDHELALVLGVSDDAVRKTWRDIMRRAEPVLPPTRRADADPHTPRRGPERRRIALDYFRQHMEELRPWKLRPAMAAPLRSQGRRSPGSRRL